MRTELKELARLFLKLGTTAFGGPAAHIAMMEEEVVKRRRWITHEEFLDLLGATNLIPGPNSTEMAIHIGYVRAGWRGLLVAGACFILPAVVITLFFASLYSMSASVPQSISILYGIRPAVIAVILAAVYRLGRPASKNLFMILVCLIVAVISLFHADEFMLLLGAGILGILWAGRHRFRTLRTGVVPPGFLPLLQNDSFSTMTAVATSGVTLLGLGLIFLKIGSVLYGGGYVLVAYLQHELVETRHWLTQTQLLDAIAVGQFTPGPVLSTATFIGYLLLGVPGATIATTAIFLPSFIFVLLSGPLLIKIRTSPLARGFLDGVNAASLGLMLAVCITLGESVLNNAFAWIVFGIAALIQVLWKGNAVWIVVGAGLLGFAVSVLR